MISLLPFLLEVACPDGFVKLISIQANGLGCSIGSCNERHRYEKIEYCARDCLSNNECKYFSWIDGKSSKDSNLCTLYAGTNSLDQTPNEPLQCKRMYSFMRELSTYSLQNPKKTSCMHDVMAVIHSFIHSFIFFF